MSKDIYDGLMNNRGVVIPSYWHEYVADLCKNSTPLDDVMAEIEELKSCCDDDWDAFLVGRKEAYNNVLQIIDKHIGKAESEEV